MNGNREGGGGGRWGSMGPRRDQVNGDRERRR